jgi:pyrimidine operon attenuation protein/uracil phosphoribosyltransferase
MAEAQERRSLMEPPEVERVLSRMADDIVRQTGGAGDLVLVGIERRGVQLARRIAAEIAAATGRAPLTGSLDITLYRDDLMSVGPRPVVGQTRLPTGGIDGRHLVIVDDVLYTGRTVRAALDELADFGRPARIRLAVLVDRGGRELPIQADFTGQTVEVPPGGVVEVLVPELDGRLGVDLIIHGEEDEG